MKAFKSSDLTHKRAEVMREAKANGVIIQELNTNGEVRCEYVLQLRTSLAEFTASMTKYYEGEGILIKKGIYEQTRRSERKGDVRLQRI